MVTIEHAMTAEELLQTPGLGRCELLHGELVMMSLEGEEHGLVVVNITVPLAIHIRQNGLGGVFGAETGFIIARNPDTVRAPDVGFVRAERVSPAPGQGFFPGPPDLAVEVVESTDRAKDVLSKVYQWLDAGCRAVWLADPASRSVTVYRSRNEIRVLAATEQLPGEDVVPGFSLPVAEVFRT